MSDEPTIDNRTAEHFLRELFEYEDCYECNQDASKHTAIAIGLGEYGTNWFAHCDTSGSPTTTSSDVHTNKGADPRDLLESLDALSAASQAADVAAYRQALTRAHECEASEEQIKDAWQWGAKRRPGLTSGWPGFDWNGVES